MSVSCRSKASVFWRWHRRRCCCCSWLQLRSLASACKRPAATTKADAACYYATRHSQPPFWYLRLANTRATLLGSAHGTAAAPQPKGRTTHTDFWEFSSASVLSMLLCAHGARSQAAPTTATATTTSWGLATARIKRRLSVWRARARTLENQLAAATASSIAAAARMGD